MIEARGIHRRLEIRVTESVKARLTKYTSTEPTAEGCLNWIGSHRQGYGAIKIDGKVYNAHCVAFVANGGEILEGHVVGHKCDNRSCVNPEHLECITIAKNNQDLQARRKIPAIRGVEIYNATLTPDLVRKIRSMYKPKEFGCKKIAAFLGVSVDAVKGVVSGRTWTHVTDDLDTSSVVVSELNFDEIKQRQAHGFRIREVMPKWFGDVDGYLMVKR